MSKCMDCGREFESSKELRVHQIYFHNTYKAPVIPTLRRDGVCPDCGGSLVHSEGCARCLNCGYSRCG